MGPDLSTSYLDLQLANLRVAEFSLPPDQYLAHVQAARATVDVPPSAP
jgi:hypothetical protein